MEKYSSREDNPSKGTDYEKNLCLVYSYQRVSIIEET